MFYKVFYDLGCCEGFYYEVFNTLDEAMEFAEKQVESEIVCFNKKVPLSNNVNILI